MNANNNPKLNADLSIVEDIATNAAKKAMESVILATDILGEGRHRIMAIGLALAELEMKSATLSLIISWGIFMPNFLRMASDFISKFPQ